MNESEIVKDILKNSGKNIDYKFLSVKSLSEIISSNDNSLNYLIDGLVYEKTINLISGQSGVGKSLLTQVIAGQLSLGSKVFGMYETRPYRVAFLDRENEHTIIKQRFNFIESNPNNIFYVELTAPFQGEVIEEVGQFLRQNQIDVVVLDTLIRFVTGDENNSQDISNFFGSLRALLKDVKAIFVIHHLKKLGIDQKSNNESARGSSDIIASVDSHWILEKVKEANDLLVLKNTKNRISKELEDVTFKITSDEDSIKLDYSNIRIEELEHKTQKTIRLIKECIDVYNEANFEQIASFVKDGDGYSQNLIRKLLKDLENTEQIKVRREGNLFLYSLNEKFVQTSFS